MYIYCDHMQHTEIHSILSMIMMLIGIIDALRGVNTSLTPAGLRGIGVTLKPKGGAKMALQKHRLYQLAQIFSIFDLFFSI